MFVTSSDSNLLEFYKEPFICRASRLATLRSAKASGLFLKLRTVVRTFKNHSFDIKRNLILRGECPVGHSGFPVAVR